MLTILVAHYAEGKGFIEHYNMAPDQAGRNTRRFMGDGVCLRIIGQGEQSVRRSIASEMLVASSAPNVQWLNFGVAGSAEWGIADVVEVISLLSGDNSELNLEYKNLASATSCQSVLEPQAHYPVSGVVDMEAYFIASELASSSLLARLTVIKLVGDGPAEPLDLLTQTKLKHHLLVAKSTITEISDKLASHV